MVVKLLIVLAIVLVLMVLIFTLLSDFYAFRPEYPYFTYEFDVSGKRNVDIDKLIDGYLRTSGLSDISQHKDYICDWKVEMQAKVDSSLFKKHHQKQLNDCINDNQASYYFRTFRRQTRYRQKNYVRTPYVVNMIDERRSYSYSELLEKYRALTKQLREY